MCLHRNQRKKLMSYYRRCCCSHSSSIEQHFLSLLGRESFKILRGRKDAFNPFSSPVGDVTSSQSEVFCCSVRS